MFVLIVEDNEDISRLLELTFTEAGHEVKKAFNGNEGLALARSLSPDLVILDIMLPGISGIDILRELRRLDPTDPADPAADPASPAIILLTAKGEEIDRIVGFELGADDYVVKPFSPRELLLRAQSVLNRKSKPAAEHLQILTHKEIHIDIAAHLVTVNNSTLALTATEFRLLSDLLQHKGKARSREELLNSVWGYSFEGYARTVDTHMRRLRQKLGSAADYIETIRGIGYKLKS